MARVPALCSGVSPGCRTAAWRRVAACRLARAFKHVDPGERRMTLSITGGTTMKPMHAATLALLLAGASCAPQPTQEAAKPVTNGPRQVPAKVIPVPDT